jgi:hypothetical protein
MLQLYVRFSFRLSAEYHSVVRETGRVPMSLVIVASTLGRNGQIRLSGSPFSVRRTSPPR